MRDDGFGELNWKDLELHLNKIAIREPEYLDLWVGSVIIINSQGVAFEQFSKATDKRQTFGRYGKTFQEGLGTANLSRSALR